MFERYTEQARRVIFVGRHEASRLGSPAVAPEHLLLGLMREDPALVRRFSPAPTRGIEPIRDKIRERTTLRESFNMSPPLPLASDTKHVLAYAQEESDSLRHVHIGTEHLLLALVREGRSVAAQVLREEGLKLDEVGTLLESTAPGDAAERKTVLGVETLLEQRLDLLRGSRVGLVCNQASVDHKLRHSADLLHQHPDVNLTALFGPQHGIRGDVQDNMIETPHAIDPVTGIPIYSLYSETRDPTQSMLDNVDVLVVDMQDVGCRIYTFAYTMANCMREAKRMDKKVIICDRPNPINGIDVAGNVLESEQASFVGQFPIPTRHGMTMAELALMFNLHFGLSCDLEVVGMEGWRREYWYDHTDVPWVMPSPNMPTVDTATVFPGAVHFEGTQLSEGRGTTRPFELIGAPYINPEEYAGALNAIGLPGVYFRSCVFRPTFQKHAGVSCGGVQIHVLDRNQFEPVTTGVAMVKFAYDLYRESFRWKDPPYEYVFDRNPFDVIAGTSKLREGIEQGTSLEEIKESWQPGLADFMKVRQRYLLY